jgi:hypothetical protein
LSFVGELNFIFIHGLRFITKNIDTNLFTIRYFEKYSGTDTEHKNQNYMYILTQNKEALPCGNASL